MTKKVGRPTAFEAEYARIAFHLALLGAMDVEMAAAFGVCEKTLNTWKRQYPQFLQSMVNGKCTADADVAAALYRRATGCTVTETQESAKGTTTIKREIPPDTMAATRWLFNRRPRDWRNEVTVKEEVTHKFPDAAVLDEIHRASLERSRVRAEALRGRRERLGLLMDGEHSFDVDGGASEKAA